ncbi:MAG: hypothetical protein BYD32DRAFT_426583 [Podila humilis]|nr:MAG: hypothetical protein BYD32DRAFT_426583 [Podila humilis]
MLPEGVIGSIAVVATVFLLICIPLICCRKKKRSNKKDGDTIHQTPEILLVTDVFPQVSRPQTATQTMVVYPTIAPGPGSSTSQPNIPSVALRDPQANSNSVE